MDVKGGNIGEQKELLTEFRFHEQLEVATNEIEELFHDADDITVYRTMINNPPEEIDYTPQIFREQDAEAVVSKAWTQEEYDKATDKQKQGYISERTLSVNDTREHAIESAKKTYSRLKKTYGTEYADYYIEEERGRYVAEIFIKSGQAKISDFKDGHGEIILNANCNWKDIEVKNIEEYKYKDE